MDESKNKNSYKKPDDKKNFRSKTNEKRESFDKKISGSMFQSILDTKLHISALNGLSTDIGGTPSAIEMVVHTGYVNFESILGDAGAWSLTSGQITAILSAFAASRGSTTAVTEAKILGYIKASITAFALLLSLFRSQNLAALTDGKGLNISDVFQIREYGNRTAVQTLQAIVSNAAPTNVDDAVSISNAVWAQHYLSELPKLKAPSAWFHIVMALCMGYFDIKGNASAYLGFYPSVASSNSSLTTLFDAEIAKLDAYIAADKDIDLMLDLFNFKEIIPVSIDFTRDLKGQTLLTVQDPKLRSFITNTQLFDYLKSGYNDSDVLSLYWDLDSPFTPFNYDDEIDVSVDAISMELLFRIGLQSTLSPAYLWISNYPRIITNSTVSGAGWCLSEMTLAAIGGIAADADKMAAYLYLMDAFRRYNFFCGWDLPYAHGVTIEMDGALTVTITSDIIAGSVLEGAKQYVLGNDLATIQNVLNISMVFGPGYRASLQALLSALKKGTTNIAY